MIGAVLPLAGIGWKVLDRFHFGGSLAVSPHGVGIAAGFLAGAWLFMAREGPRRGYPEEASSSIMFWALIGTIVGSRLGYVFTHLSQFDDPVDILRVYQGGLSQLGGVAGAILLSYVVVRRNRLPFLPGLDAAALGIPLGVVIGRIGDLIIGDHLGKPTSWALAFTYHGGNLSGYECTVGEVCRTALSGGHVQVITTAGAQLFQGDRLVSQGVGVHQTALYDLGLTMVLFVLLLWMNTTSRRAGVLFFTYVIWYGSGRILTDFLRVENRFFGLTGSQWTSILAVAFAAGMLAWFALRPERPGEPPPELAPVESTSAETPAG